MTPVETLDELINLIPNAAFSQSELRNKLFPIKDQVSALQAEHFSLRNAHTVLKNQSEDTIARLKEENQNLVAAIAKLEAENNKTALPIGHRPPPALEEVEPSAIKILKFLFDDEEEGATALTALDTEDAARFLNVKLNVAQYHLDELLKIALIDHRSDFEGYCVTTRGRAFIMIHRLA